MQFSHTKILLRCLLFSAMVVGLGACSSTKIVDSWDSDQHAGADFKKVLVVGMMKDVVNRRFFEQHFVEQALKSGMNAIPSYEYFPHPSDHDQRKELLAKVRETGADAVLLAQMKGIEKVEGRVPDRLDWYPETHQGHGFYDYYYRSYRTIYRPGYIGSDSYLKMQVRLFNVADGQLVWAGNLRTKNPRSLVQTVQDVADDVVSSIKGSGLL